MARARKTAIHKVVDKQNRAKTKSGRTPAKRPKKGVAKDSVSRKDRRPRDS